MARITLSTDEKILYRTHPSMVSFGGDMFMIVLIFILALLVFYFTNRLVASLLVLSLALLVLGRVYLSCRTCSMVITTQRLIVSAGILTRRDKEFMANRIESFEMEQSIMGRLLNFSDVVVKGTGGDPEVFRGVNGPALFMGALQSAVHGTQHTSE